MILLSLLTSFAFARAEGFHAEVLALAPHATSALVRVHADNHMFVAECPIGVASTGDLSYRSPESLAACETGGVRMLDTPANRERFDDAFAKLLGTAIDAHGRPPSSRSTLFTGLGIGGIASLAYYGLLRGTTKGSTIAWRVLLIGSAATGAFAMNVASVVAKSRLRRKAALMDAAYAFVAASPGQNPAPPLLIVSDRSAFEMIRAYLRDALEQVNAPAAPVAAR